MTATTEHGENIANEIQGEDAYGGSGPISNADVWNIIDQIHSHMMDTREPDDPIFTMLESWMDALQAIDNDLPL